MILETVKKNRETFRILEIYEEHYLKECRRTSFTWSELPDTLCMAMNKKYFEEAVRNPNIKGIVAPPAAIIYDILNKPFNKALIISEKADELFYFLHNKKLHELASPPLRYPFKSYIAPTAKIAPSAILGEKIYIGENVVIHDGSIILDNTIIKNDSVIYHNVTIGTQGFFSKKLLGKKTHIEHFGGVLIGENCLIHAGTNISRSVSIGEFTIIGDNVHIGIHTNIGHDCKIGNDCDISAKVFFAGRVKLGSGCWIGGGVIISNSIRVGNNANVKIGSVVIKDIPPGETVSGNFAINHVRNLKRFLKSEEL